MAAGKSAAGSTFKVAFKFYGFLFIGKTQIGAQLPRPIFRGMRDFTAIVPSKAIPQVFSSAKVKTTLFILKYINVMHRWPA